MINILLVVALLAAIGHWVSIYKEYRIGQIVTKPVVMAALLVWLYFSAGFNGPLIYFALGILFSLGGDIALLNFEKRAAFMAGLISFLLAHVFYIVGFNIPIQPFSMLGIFLAVMIALLGAQIYKRIAAGLAANNQLKMRIPVLVYTIAISLMLLSAMQTIFNPEWKTLPSFLVTAGAWLFLASDVILANHKFVKPIKYGRVFNLSTYHLGQMLLIVGVALQFAK